MVAICSSLAARPARSRFCNSPVACRRSAMSSTRYSTRARMPDGLTTSSGALWPRRSAAGAKRAGASPPGTAPPAMPPGTGRPILALAHDRKSAAVNWAKVLPLCRMPALAATACAFISDCTGVSGAARKARMAPPEPMKCARYSAPGSVGTPAPDSVARLSSRNRRVMSAFKAGSSRKARMAARSRPSIRSGRWRSIIASHVLSMNWPSPRAVLFGFCAVARPPLSTPMIRRRISSSDTGPGAAPGGAAGKTLPRSRRNLSGSLNRMSWVPLCRPSRSKVAIRFSSAIFSA